MSGGRESSPLSDPIALARLQVLVVPVHSSRESQPSATVALTTPVFDYWSALFRNRQSLRGDEVVRQREFGHKPGATDARERFFPSASAANVSRVAGANHVHLSFPPQPPAKHLYPLSLLRLTAFPLVIIGVAVDDDKSDMDQNEKEAAWLQAFNRTLATFMPSTSAFPLVKRLMLVPPQLPIPGSSRNSRKPKESNDPLLSYAPLDGGDNFVADVLGEVVGEVFGELGELAAALESQSGMSTLSGTVLPSLSSTLGPASVSGASTPVHSTKVESRGSQPSSNSLPLMPSANMSQPISRALTPGGRPASVQPPSAPPIQTSAIAPVAAPQPQSANPFRRSTAGLTSPFHRSSATSSPSNKDSSKDAAMAKYTSATLTGIAGGRLIKLLGDMYLVTGMYTDALKCYEDGAERCRAVGDVLWEALAREGRAVAGIIEAWEGRDGSTLSTPFSSSAVPVEILSHYLSALACLSRAPLPFPESTPNGGQAGGTPAPHLNLSAIGTGEGLLAWLYASMCLRISRFVLMIFAAGGWGSIASSALVSNTLPRTFPALLSNPNDPAKARNRRLNLVDLASRSEISRQTIFGHAQVAIGPFRRAMTAADQLAVFVEVVWLARWLELERKEASATREIIKLLAMAVVEGRDEHRNQETGLTVTSPTELPASGLNQAVTIRRKESTDGNAGVMALIERVCAVFGIDLLSFTDEPPEPVLQAAKELRPPHFGWPELQVEIMKEAIAVSEALPDHPSAVRLCVSTLHSLYSYLSPASQGHLSKLYPKALSTMRRRAIEFGTVPWWLPDSVVLSVEISSLASNKVPLEHTRAEIIAEGKKDPFLYNPRVKAPELGKTLLVANEQVDVFVTLQNVFAFDLEVQNLSLLTAGAPFITNPLPLILPASSVQTVRVTGLAPNAGSLEIRGVSIRLMDGSSAEFLLPVVDGAGARRDSKHRSRVQAEAAKTKQTGLDARKSLLFSPIDGGLPPLPAKEEEHRWLECNVVEEQPLLWIKKTSLSHGTVMLFNGETSVIRITLENSSSVPVDFVKLSFDDSVSRDAHALMSEEISPQQAYDLDHDTVQRPVFTWDRNSRVSIPPGGRATLQIDVLGKVGCTDGSIRIDYGFVGRAADADAPAGVFYTRRITFPVLFTVYHTLEPFALDIACLRSSPASQAKLRQRLAAGAPQRSTFGTSADEVLRRALAQDDDNMVLFCLNVRNVYSVPFEVALSGKRTGAATGEGGGSEDAGGSELAVTRLVPPGATERLVLPIQRQALADDGAPIPTPEGRQYVVQKSKLSPEQLARQRQLFWYREALLGLVDVSWREPSSLRSGRLSLRDQPIQPAHLDALRRDQLAIAIDVLPRSGAEAFRAMDFVDLRISIVNRLERALRTYVRLEALPTSSSDASWSQPPAPTPRRVSSLPAAPMPAPKSIAFDGVLGAAMPLLEPGESATHTVGAVLLASGSFTFRAAAEEIADRPDPPPVCFSPSVSVDVA